VIDSSIPKPIVTQVLSPLGVVAAHPTSPGMSGASVYQCRRNAGDSLALKCWPIGTRRARIEEVHRVLRWSSQHGCSVVPELYSLPTADRSQTLYTHDDRHWDVMQWMPGEASGADASLDQIRSGAAAIAQFHESVRGLGVQHQPPPAVTARLRRLSELDTLVPELIAIAGRSLPDGELGWAMTEAARVVRSKWGGARSQIARSLHQYAAQNAPTQYVLRDIHRGHLLFTDQDPIGLIDFDSVRIDTPATDLARWVGSFLVGRQEVEIVWNAALAGFRDVYSLNGRSRIAIDRRLAVEICFATTWISLVNWLDWILCQQRSFPPGPALVASRVHELTRMADHCES
jgi:Ser/Thr protein kinase RdoA (MazF antagonist)